MARMICDKCKKEIHDSEAKFCIYCGNPLFKADVNGEPASPKKETTGFDKKKLTLMIAILAVVLAIIGSVVLLANNRNKSSEELPPRIEEQVEVKETLAAEADDGFVMDCTEAQRNSLGNTNANLRMGGRVAAQGDWVYWLINNCIFKQNVKEKGEVVLVHKWDVNSSSRLSVCGEWLYCQLRLNADVTGLWRIRTDGSMPERITDRLNNTNTQKYITTDYVVCDNILYLRKFTQSSSEKFSGSLIEYNLDTREEKTIFELGECGMNSNDGYPLDGDTEWHMLGVDESFIYLYYVEDFEETNTINKVIYVTINRSNYSDVNYVDGGEIPSHANDLVGPTFVGRYVHGGKIYTYDTEELIICDVLKSGHRESINFTENGLNMSDLEEAAIVRSNPVVNVGPSGEGIVTNLCRIEMDFFDKVKVSENLGITVFDQEDNIRNFEANIVTEDTAEQIYTVGDGSIYYVIERGINEPLEIYRILDDGTGWERLPAKSDEVASYTVESYETASHNTETVYEDTNDMPQILVEQGGVVFGIIEKRIKEGDMNIGGADTEYYVIRFDQLHSFELYDAEQGKEYVAEGYMEIPIYAPAAGNMGELDLSEYEGKEVSCYLYASETYTSMGVVAEAIGIESTDYLY